MIIKTEDFIEASPMGPMQRCLGLYGVSQACFVKMPNWIALNALASKYNPSHRASKLLTSRGIQVNMAGRPERMVVVNKNEFLKGLKSARPHLKAEPFEASKSERKLTLNDEGLSVGDVTPEQYLGGRSSWLKKLIKFLESESNLAATGIMFKAGQNAEHFFQSPLSKEDFSRKFDIADDDPTGEVHDPAARIDSSHDKRFWPGSLKLKGTDELELTSFAYEQVMVTAEVFGVKNAIPKGIANKQKKTVIDLNPDTLLSQQETQNFAKAMRTLVTHLPDTTKLKVFHPETIAFGLRHLDRFDMNGKKEVLCDIWSGRIAILKKVATFLELEGQVSFEFADEKPSNAEYQPI